MPVNPSEAAFFDELEKLAEESPQKPLAELSIEEFRAGGEAFREYCGEYAEVSFSDDVVVARDGYQIPIRIFNDTLNEPGPALIFYPGCGYIFDLFYENSVSVSRLAQESGIKVILVNHRLVPEHPLPMPIYDGYDVAKYVYQHAEQFGLLKDKLLIGGISSGAHCAAVIANLARADEDLAICHQILLNGAFDTAINYHQYDSHQAEDRMLNAEMVAHIFSIWGADLNNSLISPAREADLSGLPNTSILVGEYDALRNHSELYYDLTSAVNDNVEKLVLPG